ncbi:erythromycin esterase family protein [Pendulispora brunnea]|uniref:Erythromycin esterase family protein n=1 Tax=Pendulispora brunnea TaxID=2905690 RepID=A0ABZ2JX55_9BACT
MFIRSVIGLVAAVGLVGCADSANTAENAASSQVALEAPVDMGIHRFDGIDPSLPTADLQRLRAIVGGARIVGLGEGTHASGGYHELHERVARFMIQEMGFRVVTLETPRWRAEKVNDYVATCQGDVNEVLLGMFGVFRSSNMRNLVTWMCQWNQEHPYDRVRFTGFDMQEPWAQHMALEAFLHDGMPEDADALYARLSTCNGIKAVSNTDYYENYDHLPYPKEAQDACHRGLDALEAYWQEHECDIVERTSARALALARIDLVAFRQWQHRRSYEPSSLGSYQARDTGMAYILTNQWRIDGRPKTIAWAHNGHLQYTPYGPQGHDPHGAIPMGAQLKEDLGHDYAAIAMVGYDVGIRWPGEEPEWLPPPPADSVEGKLHAFGEPYLLVDLKRVSSRFLEPGKEYELNDDMDVPGKAFRALLYLDRSEPMTPSR